VTQGVGIRVIVGESAGYAFSDDLSFEALQRAARIASLIARDGTAGAGSVKVSRSTAAPFYDTSRDAHAPSEAYVKLLERADVAARAFDPRISAVNATITDELQDVWIATSDGRYVHDHRPLISLGVQAVSTRNGDRAQGFVGDGGRRSRFTNTARPNPSHKKRRAFRPRISKPSPRQQARWKWS
jgi:TldD protein